MHPIFQWLDYKYDDYGMFARLMDERRIGSFKNRFLLGLNLHNGAYDANQYVNGAGAVKGTLLSSSRNDAKNATAYVENAFYFLPQVAAVAGVQFMDAKRTLRDKFLTDGDQSGQSAFRAWSPKVGLLWELDKTTEVFANVAKSAEAPSFGENSYASAAAFDAKLQTATTFELGTRSRKADYWLEAAIYRSNIRNELQCTFPIRNC